MKFPISIIEFYITNVCNFDCTGCNRFNNYNFSGSSQWEDYKDVYAQWATRLNIDTFAILGGEPMANKDYMNWWQGLSNLWPNASSELLTNGSLLKLEDKKIYNFLKERPHLRLLKISLHNKNRIAGMIEFLQNWMTPPIQIKRIPENVEDLPNFNENFLRSYNNIKAKEWPDINNLFDWASLPDSIKKECEINYQFSPELIANERKKYLVIDSAGVRILVQHESFFHQGALIANHIDQTFTLYNSDPKKAHDICHSKYCYHFNNGNLYKCGQVDLFKDIDKQFNLILSDEDRELLYSYKPAAIDMTDLELQQFLNNLPNQLDQCKFCPESYNIKEIKSATKNKIIFKKRQNNS